MIDTLKVTLDMTAETSDKEGVVDAMRQDSNAWVAKYRRQRDFGGRPSYGNTYSAINAVLGHYNNFGSTTLFPKKRLTRVLKVSRYDADAPTR